jgi:hypothetical protein
MAALFPSRQKWKRWSLPSKLTEIGAYLAIVGIVLSLALFFWPTSQATADVTVSYAFFRTRLLDSVAGNKALLLEVTQDLKSECLEQPVVAWVTPSTNVEIRGRDDVGVRFIIGNAGDSPATARRISVAKIRWTDRRLESEEVRDSFSLTARLAAGDRRSVGRGHHHRSCILRCAAPSFTVNPSRWW